MGLHDVLAPSAYLRMPVSSDLSITRENSQAIARFCRSVSLFRRSEIRCRGFAIFDPREGNLLL
jgi:hypothetical protein